MYTNTPLDNHWAGTAPFFIVDPTTERNFVQSKLLIWLNPVFLFFGIFPANYFAHFVQLVCREENLSIGKIFYPLQLLILAHKWGPYGIFLQLIATGMCSIYYFTIALMNHNTEAAWNIDGKNTSDWGIAQVYSCADIEPGLTFFQSVRYLWLNYHTVHHLFPHTDMSKHPGIQKILIETCKEFDVKYELASFTQMYKEMMHTFAYPRHLGKEVKDYFH